MLIKKDSVASIIVKDGKIAEIIHYSDGKFEKCWVCGKLTVKRFLGTPECEECSEFRYEKCMQCKYGIRKSNFVVGPTDLDDHIEFYTACAIRDYFLKLRDKPNFKECPSSWHVSISERKKCFAPKDPEKARICKYLVLTDTEKRFCKLWKRFKYKSYCRICTDKENWWGFPISKGGK